MIARAELESLVPHAGTMCLLDSVMQWDAQRITAQTLGHRRYDNPLRNADGRITALHLIEYGAQAMAVHGGLLARQQGGSALPGYLASARSVKLQTQYIDDISEPLTLQAEMLSAGDGGWQYRFSASADDRELASGRVAVILMPQDDV